MKLKLADTLSLPLDAVTKRLAMLGNPGAGKTYGAMKLAELMIEAHAQVIALDPVGVWFGLRLAADGKSPGIPIPVFGGLRGDVPLEPGAGALVADLIIDRSINAVLDVSQFEHDTDKARFATDFAKRFFFRKKASPSAVHVFMEECQEFLPEEPQRNETHMLHEFTRMWKLGRNFGIGGTLVSQRPQEVSKKALNLSHCVFAFQLTGTHERESVRKWTLDKSIKEDVAETLPRLAVGHARVWSPAWLGGPATVHILPRETFNASSTPEVGKRSEVRELAPIDLEKIRKDMAATIERAKAEDPKELQKRIAELERELKKAQTPAVAPKSAPDPDALKKEFDRGAHSVKRELAKKLREYQTTWERLFNVYAGGFDLAIGAVQRLSEDLGAINEKAIGTPSPLKLDLGVIIEETIAHRQPDTPKQAYDQLFKREPSRNPQPVKKSAPMSGNGSLPAGEQAVLTVCAQYYEQGATREQISILTGYKRSTRDAYIQRLREKGLVNGAGDRIICCEDGLTALGPDFEPLPTGAALQDYWLARLPAGESKILGMLIAAKGNTISRDSIDKETGFARSSRDAYIQRLKARQLVKLVGRGEVAASEVLFG